MEFVSEPIMRHLHHPSSHHRSSGVSLLFALLSLAALSLAALALVRSVDTSALVLGNLGFKQDATAVSDRVSKAAITWLTTTAVDLNNDSVNDGYYATANEDLDATGQQSTSSASPALVNWDINNCAYAGDLAGRICKVNPSNPAISYADGTKARYIIFRLCSSTGPSTSSANSCLSPPVVSSATGTGTCNKRGKLGYDDSECFISTRTGSKAYYRIVVRVEGARGTTSFTETIVYL